MLLLINNIIDHNVVASDNNMVRGDHKDNFVFFKCITGKLLFAGYAQTFSHFKGFRSRSKISYF